MPEGFYFAAFLPFFQNHRHKKQRQQLPKSSNTTDTLFTKEEIHLLNKGLQYNLHHKQKNWIETLGLEAETAISNLDPAEQ
jgi:CRISPR/Cas system-associated endonuclease Cas1